MVLLEEKTVVCVVKQSNVVEIMHLVPSTDSGPGYSEIELYKVRSSSHHFPIDNSSTYFRNGISQTIHLPDPTEVLFIRQQPGLGKLWLWSDHQVDIVDVNTGVVEQRLEVTPPVFSPVKSLGLFRLCEGPRLFCYYSPFSLVVSVFLNIPSPHT